jgi:hypothetical protein
VLQDHFAKKFATKQALGVFLDVEALSFVRAESDLFSALLNVH